MGVFRLLVCLQADASLFHLGKVPMLKPHWFSMKKTMHALCQDVMQRDLVPDGVSCILSLGHGDTPGVPWSASLEEVTWEGQDHVDSVKGDRAKIVRVLRLLLATALERTSAGTVKLGVTFWPGTGGKKPSFSFSVSDTGRQVDKAWIHERFHSYFLQKAATGSVASNRDLQIEGDTSGCDLGLFVGYHLVQTLGGCLDCFHHEDGNGQTFAFTIPLDGGIRLLTAPSPTRIYRVSIVYLSHIRARVTITYQTYLMRPRLHLRPLTLFSSTLTPRGVPVVNARGANRHTRY